MNPRIPPDAHAHGFDPYATIPSGDVGWFGSKLVKKATKAVKSAARVVSHVPGVATMTAPIALASDVAHGKNVVRSVTARAGSVVRDTRAGLPIAASVVSFVPGVGQGLGMGLNALSAASQGKSLAEIAKDAALGAIPGGAIAEAAFNAMKTGIRGGNVLAIAEAAARGTIPASIEQAVHFAADAMRGKNITNLVLKTAANQFLPGTQEALGFGAAAAVLRKAGDLTQLAGVRRTLTSEGARRAFDSAVGTVAKTALSQSKPRFIPQALYRAPAKPAKLNHLPVTARAAQVLADRVRSVSLGALVGRPETAGLTNNASTYVVESGDSPWKISLKLMKNGNLWPQLVKANPQKKTVQSGANKGGFVTLFAGEELHLPSSWTSQLATTISADAMAQARAILLAWSTADGKNEAGVTDYGSKPDDTASTWGARDRFMLTSFCNWRNRLTGSTLPTTGELIDATANALRAWAAEHAAAPSTPVVPAVVPSVPVVVPTAPANVVFGGDTITRAPDAQPAATPASVPTVTPSAVPAAIPADVQALYDSAKVLTNPTQIRTIAGQLYQKGYTALSDDLNTYADKLEAAQMGVPDPNPSAVTTIPVTVTGQAPTTPTAAAAPGEDNMGLLIAGGLILAKVAHFF